MEIETEIVTKREREIERESGDEKGRWSEVLREP